MCSYNCSRLGGLLSRLEIAELKHPTWLIFLDEVKGLLTYYQNNVSPPITAELRALQWEECGEMVEVEENVLL